MIAIFTQYRNGLEEYVGNLRSSNPTLQWSQVVAAALAKSPIPEKPNLTNQEIKPCNTGSERNSFASSVSALSNQIKREQAMHHAAGSAATKEVKTLDELRNMAIAKGALLKSMEEKVRREQETRDECSRLRMLPRICDSLRALFVLNRRTTIIANECYNKLAMELRRNILDVEKMVHTLACIAPEFVTIFPADDTIPVCTLRINKEAPYRDVRNKVMQAVKLRTVNLMQGS